MDSWTRGPVDSWTDFFLNFTKMKKKHRGTEYDFLVNMYHAALPRFRDHSLFMAGGGLVISIINQEETS